MWIGLFIFNYVVINIFCNFYRERGLSMTGNKGVEAAMEWYVKCLLTVNTRKIFLKI